MYGGPQGAPHTFGLYIFSYCFSELGTFQERCALHLPLEKTISQKKVTYDLERQMQSATLLKCSEFGKAVADNI